MRRGWFSLLLVAMSLALTFTPPLAAAPLQILWDDTHDTDPPTSDELSAGYTKFDAAVTAAGHDLFELDGFPGDLTAAVLASYDVLMLFDTEHPFTTDEVAAIQGFVANGGSVLVTGEQSLGFAEASYNELLAPYGLQFTGGTIFSTFDLTFFEPDPLTAGIFTLDFLTGGVLSVSGADTKVLGRTFAGGDIGFAYGAGGHVVVLSDSNLFVDTLITPGAGELQLIANLLAHFMALTGDSGSTGPYEITIDIQPGGSPNPVNPKSMGVVPVAILTTSVADGDDVDFDPWETIDVTTLRFGPDQAALAYAQGEAEDVDGDGDIDMVVHFRTQEIGVVCGATELTLTGEMYDGAGTVTGTDAIVTPGCK